MKTWIAIIASVTLAGSVWALEPGTVSTQAPAAAPAPESTPAATQATLKSVGASSVESESGDEDAPAPQAPSARVIHSSAVKSKGGNRAREKDADGTEAPNRFQADTVIKSQYKLNGQPLEVDPD